jgi:hypothetical protein
MIRRKQMRRSMILLASAGLAALPFVATASSPQPTPVAFSQLDRCAVTYQFSRIIYATEYSAVIETTPGKLFRVEFSKACYDATNEMAVQFQNRRMVADLCIGPNSALSFNVRDGTRYTCRIGRVEPIGQRSS